VSLPQQLQRAMAAEAEASREARAKVIAAEGEMKASRALKEAADVISEAPGALQVLCWRERWRRLNGNVFSAAVSTNSQQYFSGEELYNHISVTN
jgi:regulator of protease activity HflC (stomatin/prohibitin superfamily)